jgi:hypothetical protein
MPKHMYKRIGLVVGALVLTGAFAATAAAVITVDTGGAELRVDKRTSNTPSTTHNTVWSDLPGASLVVSVPANGSRLYDVPFFAETQCAGPGGGGACSVRIVAVNLDTGVPTELNPVAGLDYAFDSDMAGATDDLREGHGLERSKRLFADADGTNYQIEVQYAVTNNMITFTLDDWHLAVHTNA